MRSQVIFLMCFVFALAMSALGQSRSVTNASLESYKLERLKNEREYRENYEQLGLPSPEEIDRRTEKSRIEMERLAAHLRQEEFNQAVFTAQSRAFNRLSEPSYSGPQVVYYPYWNGGGYYWSGWWRRPHISHPMVTPYARSGYFAGGQFWSTGSRPMGNVQEANGAPR